ASSLLLSHVLGHVWVFHCHRYCHCPGRYCPLPPLGPRSSQILAEAACFLGILGRRTRDRTWDLGLVRVKIIPLPARAYETVAIPRCHDPARSPLRLPLPLAALRPSPPRSAASSALSSIPRAPSRSVL